MWWILPDRGVSVYIRPMSTTTRKDVKRRVEAVLDAAIERKKKKPTPSVSILTLRWCAPAVTEDHGT